MARARSCSSVDCCAGELVAALPRFVGPGRGWVALQVVVPGLAGRVHEVELLERESAVEPGFDRRVLLLDRALGGFERLRDVRGLVETARAHEVGSGQVALEPGVLRVLCGRRLERLHRAVEVARDQVCHRQCAERLGRCRSPCVRGCARRRRAPLAIARPSPAGRRPSAGPRVGRAGSRR